MLPAPSPSSAKARNWFTSSTAQPCDQPGDWAPDTRRPAANLPRRCARGGPAGGAQQARRDSLGGTRPCSF